MAILFVRSLKKSLKKEKKKKKEDAARVRRTKKDRKESKRRKEANLKDKTQPIVGTEAQADEGIALKNVQAKEAGSSRSPTRPPARPPTLSPTLTATLSPTLPPTLPPLPTGEQFEKMSEFFAAEVALDDVSPEQGPSELVSKRTQMMQKLTKLTTVDTSPAASPTTTITVEEEAKEPERAAKKPFLEKEEGVGASEQATEKIEIPIEETVFKSSPMLQDLFSPVIKLKRLLVLERLHMAIRDNDMKTVASMCNASSIHASIESALFP